MERSLVADYSASESDEEEDLTGKTGKTGEFEEGVFGKVKGVEEVDDDDSSSENSDQDELKDSKSSESGALPRLTLDNPFRNFEENKVKKEDSVFQIPFREQEKQESAALERHVKMTPLVGTQLTINGKKICWNYRKGKCRFGHNCAFAHDSDIILPVEHANSTNKNTKPKSTGTSTASVLAAPAKKETSNFLDQACIWSGAQLGGWKQKPKAVDNSDDEFEPDPPQDTSRAGIGKFGKNNKKRPGLSQTLVPGKKVMKNYFDQKNNK